MVAMFWQDGHLHIWERLHDREKEITHCCNTINYPCPYLDTILFNLLPCNRQECSAVNTFHNYFVHTSNLIKLPELNNISNLLNAYNKTLYVSGILLSSRMRQQIKGTENSTFRNTTH
jgi:hypothetical protein